MDPLFLQIIQEAWKADFSGWDFSWLEGRYVEEEPAWDYRALVLERMKDVQAMVDMGTGGGEFFSTLRPYPTDTWATEAYVPNVPIARARLEPLGVKLVQVFDDNDLPLPGNHFDLAINRHESFSGKELARILKPGGKFLTQQIGCQNSTRLNELLEETNTYEYADETLEKQVASLTSAGFEILQAREDFPVAAFRDIAAVVYYLKVISWQIPGFTPEAYLEGLEKIHATIQREGELVVPEHRYLIEAVKH